MPGKNQPAPLPFVMQVLTPQYLIEGTAPGATQLYLPRAEEYWYPITLTDARIRTVGRPDLRTRSIPQIVVGGNSVVAVIFRADVSQLERYDVWKAYKEPRAGVFHIGPYLIQGKMMFLGSNRFDLVVPMVEVQITQASLETDLGDLSAPFMLVNTDWMSSYLPA